MRECKGTEDTETHRCVLAFLHSCISAFVHFHVSLYWVPNPGRHDLL
jgi:hypothetical protein